MQESKQANGETPSLFKENYPPPRTYYSLIGCSPSAQLSSRERQNTWWENCPCMCADYVYHLEHSCQRHLIMANVRAAPNIVALYIWHINDSYGIYTIYMHFYIWFISVLYMLYMWHTWHTHGQMYMVHTCYIHHTC